MTRTETELREDVVKWLGMNERKSAWALASVHKRLDERIRKDAWDLYRDAADAAESAGVVVNLERFERLADDIKALVPIIRHAHELCVIENEIKTGGTHDS